MAADFKPVGVRAVVLDADKFIADLGRMQAAVGAFVTSARSVGASQARAAAGAAQATAGFSANATAAQAAANSQVQYATTVATAGASQVRLAASTLSTVDALTILAARIAQARQQQQMANNTALQTIAGNQRLSNSLLKLVQQRAMLQQAIAKNQQAQKQARGQIDQESNARAKLSERIAKQRIASLRLREQIAKTSATQKAAQQSLGIMSVEISKLDSKTGKYASKIRVLQDKMTKAKGTVEETTIRLQRLGDQLGQSDSKAEQFANEMAQSAAKTEVLGNKLDELGTDAGQLNARLIVVEGSMRRLASIAGKMGAAMAIARAGMTAAAGAARVLGRAMLIPHNLVGAFGTGILRLGKAGESISRGLFRMGNSVRFLGQSLTFFVSLPIAAVLGGMAKAAIDFETSFTKVVKTVDGLVKPGTLNTLNEQGENLRSALRLMALEIPFAASELADLTAIAGQLGVRGNANLIGFTRVAADLAASTDVDMNQAATALARLINVTGLLDDAQLQTAGFSRGIESVSSAVEAAGGELTELERRTIPGFAQGVGEAVTESERFNATAQAMGGVLVNLGNTLPATESEILTFTRDIGGVGAALRFAQEDIFGMATAFAAVGVPAARGSTAVQTVMVEMIGAIQEGGEALDVWAKLAKTSSEDFAASFEEGGRRFGDSFVNIFDTLTQLGPDAIQVLDAIDVGNRRNLKSILPVITANGQLRRSIDNAREGYQVYGEELSEFNALQLESLRAYDTTQSKLQILKNQFTDLGITVGAFLLPIIVEFTEVLRGIIQRISQMNPEVLKMAVGFLLAVAAIGPLVTIGGLLAASLGLVLLTLFKIVVAIGTVISVLGGFVIPIVAVIAALAGLVVAYIASFNKIQEITGAAQTSLVQRMFAFGKNIIIAFARGMAAALVAVLNVLIQLGNLIAHWLQALSPPRLLPDLENWGAAAMESYMIGWTKADFGIFEQIAGKIESFIRSLGDRLDVEGVVPSILGSREAIAQAIALMREVGEVTSNVVDIALGRVPQASAAVREYVTTVLQLKLASDLVAEAQENLTAVTKKYEDALKPLNDRLGEIADRRQEVRDMMRLEELQEILSDPRASDLVRELANLEIEEIGLDQQIDDLEDARDAELELAQAQLEAAEAALAEAENNLAEAEALLDIQIRNNELVQEQIDLMESLRKKMKKVKEEKEKIGKGGDFDEVNELLDGLGAGGLEPPEIPDPNELIDLDEMFEGLEIDPVIDTILGDIENSILEIAGEITTAFAPVVELWDELGRVWAPVFLGLRDFWFDEAKPAVEDFIERVGVAKTDAEKWATEGIGKVRTALEELGLIKTPILEEDSLIAIGQGGARQEGPEFSFIDRLQQSFEKFKGLPVISQISSGLATLLDLFKIAGNVFSETVGPALISIGPAFSGLGDSLSRLGESLQESGLLDLFVRIGEILAGFVAGQVISFVAVALGVLAGIITAIARNIQVAAPFLIGFFEGLGRALLGVVRFIKGFLGFFVNLFKLIADPENSEAFENLRKSVIDMGEGLLEFIVGLGQSFLSLFLGIIAGGVALIGGFLEGFIGVIIGILGLLPGEAAAKIAEFLEGVKTAITDFLDLLAGWGQEVLEAMGGWVDGIIEFFQGLWDDLVGDSIVPDMLQDIIDAFTGWVTESLEIIGGWVEETITWFENVRDAITTAIGTAITNVTIAILGFILSALGWWAQMWLDANTKWNEIKLLISTKIAELIIDITTKILGLLADFISWWAQLWLDANAGWELVKTLISDALQAIWDAVVEWATPFLEAMQQPINDFIDWIKSTLIGKGGVFWDMGRGIVQSLIDGLKSKLEALRKMAQKVIAAAKGGASDEAEEGSPMKLFVRFGEDMMDSLAMGMAKAANRVQVAGQQATVQARAGMSAGVGQTVAAPLAPAAGSSSVSIDFGGQQITNGMDAVEFRVLVERTVRDLL